MKYRFLFLPVIVLIPVQILAQNQDTAIFESAAINDSTNLIFEEMELPEAFITPYISYAQFKHALITLHTNITPIRAQESIRRIVIQPDFNLDQNKRLNNLMLSKDYNNNSILFLTTDKYKGLWGFFTLIDHAIKNR